MPADHDTPTRVFAAANEMEAAVVVGVLDAAGIPARMSNVMSSSFRTEAPTDVGVFVRDVDLARARNLLSQSDDVDWSRVDVGEAEAD